jgi:hypothetical protein
MMRTVSEVDPTSTARLFHFSDDPGIERFVPRPVRVPAERPPGWEWLNGPLVWAVSEVRQAAYLFPRDCPRILLWPTADTTDADREQWWGDATAGTLAYVERGWLERIQQAALVRYELPSKGFEPVDGDWFWVSHNTVTPTSVVPCGDLLDALAGQDVEVRALDDLRPLRDVWSTTLHASGIRLRNARAWTPA